MVDLDNKRSNEKKVLEEMIKIYCHGVHKTTKGEMCGQCKELFNYASVRTDKCPFMETKTFCSGCTVHCYSKKYKEDIRQVMKYSGPRMAYKHPLLVCKHAWLSLNIKLKRKGKV